MMKAQQILIIDDDPAISFLLNKILSDRYTVYSCNNAMDALCWLTEGNLPDLIVTDLVMPSLTGIELLEQLHESGMFKGIPVIILSGLADPEKEKRSIELGVNSFLRKPFTPDSLLEAIDKIMECKDGERPIKLNDKLYA
ncbi:MAG TPA: response regulator [Cyclobacteriaceae bacterium]|jgi:CheY-like chemotaxis protein|nr:response regulator [Cyclobacteriaceae bacterium]